ncbi:MAG: hypothetical protein ABW217_02910 [Polyangiaceae bacterium]
MPPIDPHILEQVEAELERRGLLLLHDRALPSITTLVAGAPIAGSWWAHPKGNEIYQVVEELERGARAVALKLVNGKVTFVHRRLWPLLLAATGGESSARPSSAVRELLSLLETGNTLHVAELRRSGTRAPVELKRAVEEIERRLLAFVTSEHTEGGKHEKVLQRWSDWARGHEVEAAPVTPESARAELETIAVALSTSGTRVRLAWT